MTMNCDRASFLMSKDQDKPLSIMEKLSMKFHLMICTACRISKIQIGRIRDICKISELESTKIKAAKLSDDFKVILKQRLDEDTQS